MTIYSIVDRLKLHGTEFPSTILNRQEVFKNNLTNNVVVLHVGFQQDLFDVRNTIYNLKVKGIFTGVIVHISDWLISRGYFLSDEYRFKFDRQSDEGDHISNYSSGKKVSDWYKSLDGEHIRVVLVRNPENEQGKERLYLDEYGNVFLKTKIHLGKSGYITDSIEVSDGNTLISFSSEDELVTYFLNNILKEEDVVIVDQPQKLMPVLQYLKNKITKIYQYNLSMINRQSDSKGIQQKAQHNFEYMKRNIFLMDYIVVENMLQKKEFINQRMPDDKVKVISWPIVKDDENIIPNKYSISFISSLTEKNGIKNLVPILKLITEKVPQVHLDIYGEGTGRKLLEQELTQTELNKYVTFNGYAKSPIKALKRSLVSIQLSDFDSNYSLVTQESLVNKVPIVAWKSHGQSSEFIINGINGYEVEVGQNREFAEKVIELLTDSSLYDRISNGGVTFDFTEKLYIEKWDTLMRSARPLSTIESTFENVDKLDTDLVRINHEFHRENILSGAGANSELVNQLNKLAGKDYILFDGKKTYSEFVKREKYQTTQLASYDGVYYQLDKVEKKRKTNMANKLVVFFLSLPPVEGLISNNPIDRSFTSMFTDLQRSVVKDTFVLRVADFNLVKGSFYVNSINYVDYEEKIEQLIRKVMIENNISIDNVVTYGVSRGGVGAMIHGAKLGSDFLAVDPIINDSYYVENMNDVHYVGNNRPKDLSKYFEQLSVDYRAEGIILSNHYIVNNYPYLDKLILPHNVSLIDVNDNTVTEHPIFSRNTVPEQLMYLNMLLTN